LVEEGRYDALEKLRLRLRDPELDEANRRRLDALRPAYEARPKKAGRRPVPPERIQRVAAVYRRALAEGRRPTQAVKDDLGVSRSQASKLVMRARAEGFLGPTEQRKAGEKTTKTVRRTT
jgi:hypothetical protein